MDVNAVVRQGAPAPGASPVVRTPSSAARGSGAPAVPVIVQAPAPDVSQNELVQAAIQAVEARRAQVTPSGLRLHVDEATDRVVAEIVNESNEVIKQLPPKEALRIAARFRQMVGLIFDQQI